MSEHQEKEWIILNCLDAWHDAQGNAGMHKVPFAGYDKPMTRADAWEALKEVETLHPDKDFSMRKIAPVIPIK